MTLLYDVSPINNTKVLTCYDATATPVQDKETLVYVTSKDKAIMWEAFAKEFIKKSYYCCL